MIRAVTFDVGGTLLEPWPSVGHVYAEVAAQFGIRGLSPGLLNDRFRQAWTARLKFDYERGSWEGVVQRTFAGLGSQAPSAACFAAIYERFGRAAAWRVFGEVRSVLESLRKRGLQLGVISNWDERLRPLLDELQLDECFDAITVSHEVGCTKPGHAIFAEAAARLDLPTGEILHVGDSAAEDVAGAQAAGFRAVLLDRSATGEKKEAGWGEGHERPPEVLRGLEQLANGPWLEDFR